MGERVNQEASSVGVGLPATGIAAKNAPPRGRSALLSQIVPFNAPSVNTYTFGMASNFFPPVSIPYQSGLVLPALKKKKKRNGESLFQSRINPVSCCQFGRRDRREARS